MILLQSMLCSPTLSLTTPLLCVQAFAVRWLLPLAIAKTGMQQDQAVLECYVIGVARAADSEIQASVKTIPFISKSITILTKLFTDRLKNTGDFFEVGNF